MHLQLKYGLVNELIHNALFLSFYQIPKGSMKLSGAEYLLIAKGGYPRPEGIGRGPSVRLSYPMTGIGNIYIHSYSLVTLSLEV